MGDGSVLRPGRRRKHLKPYTTLYKSNFRDTAKELRRIAKLIESGELAPVSEGALVLDCTDGTYRVFRLGPNYADAYSTLSLFRMGEAECVEALCAAKEIQAEAYKPPRLDDE